MFFVLRSARFLVRAACLSRIAFATVFVRAAHSSPAREDGRLLQSLGREVVKSAGKAADLAQPAVAEGVEWRKLEGDIKGELTYPRCFFLYNSLMFFVFRVRVKRRVRKGKGEERTFEDRLKLAPR